MVGSSIEGGTVVNADKASNETTLTFVNGSSTYRGSAHRMGAFVRPAGKIIGAFTQPSTDGLRLPTERGASGRGGDLIVPKLSFTCQAALSVRQCITQSRDIPVLIVDRTCGTHSRLYSLSFCRHVDTCVK